MYLNWMPQDGIFTITNYLFVIIVQLPWQPADVKFNEDVPEVGVISRGLHGENVSGSHM